MAASEKQICPACGARINDDATVCDVCGYVFPESAEVAEDATMPEPVAAPEPAVQAPPEPAPQPRPAPQQRAASATQQKSGKSSRSVGQGKNTRRPNTITFSVTRGQLLFGSIVGIAIIAAVIYIATNDGGSTSTLPGAQNPAAGSVPPVNLQRLEDLRKQMEANPSDAETILHYANELHDARMIEQAVAAYKRYLDRVPDNPDAGIDLGVCYFELRDFPAAIAQMEAVVAKHPTHQLGHFNLGIVNRNAGNEVAAVEWFRKAIAIDPTSRVAENAKMLLDEKPAVQN
ncbi:MAG: tetratricopeptide repeat protein [Ignavibacteriae bacterium]|nr:tetratricopeptide repeat protein [Ignavibacteriota bacterium]